MKFLLAIWVIFTATATATAQAESNRPYLGLGTFFQNMLKITNQPKGSATFLGESYFPELVVGYRMEHFFPSFGWTILGNKSNDGSKKRGILRLNLPYLIGRHDRFEFKGGAGLLFYRIYGDASTVSIRNGASGTGYTDFYVPGESRSSQIFYVSGGAGYVYEKWRTDLDILISGPLSRKRALNLAIRGGYVF
jgi:hypothetical protein